MDDASIGRKRCARLTRPLNDREQSTGVPAARDKAPEIAGLACRAPQAEALDRLSRPRGTPWNGAAGYALGIAAPEAPTWPAEDLR
jgi:hypothetical protein